jgi:hypothetical protein
LAGIIKQGCPTAPHFTGMGQKTANIDIRVEPELVEKAWELVKPLLVPDAKATLGEMLKALLTKDDVK